MLADCAPAHCCCLPCRYVTFAIGVVAECAALSVVGPTVVSLVMCGMVQRARAWCSQRATASSDLFGAVLQFCNR
jgi:hypothetical protein